MDTLQTLSNVGISIFTFLFIMFQASWPINDKPVPWYYPVNGFIVWLLLMSWLWGGLYEWV